MPLMNLAMVISLLLGVLVPSAVPLPLVTTGAVRDGRTVALTFDDGPDLVTTPILLDYLDDLGLKVTFFVVGRRIAHSWRAREVLAEEYRRGHAIGNHSFSHPVMSRIPPDSQVKELVTTQELVRRVLGVKTRIYRPPYGVLTRYIRHWLAKKGYTIVMWNLDSNDPFDHSAAKVYEYVMKYLSIKEGGILLFHDTHIWSVSAVPAIVKEMMRRNCALIARGEQPVYFTGLDRFGVRPGAKNVMPTDEELARAEAQYARMVDYCKSLDAEGTR